MPDRLVVMSGGLNAVEIHPDIIKIAHSLHMVG